MPGSGDGGRLGRLHVVRVARPQFENKFPKGATASISQIWEKETGIKLKFIETQPATEYQTNLRNASTKNGSFDLVTYAITDTGDFAEAGLVREIDDFVAKHKPSWLDPKWGYAGGKATVKLFNQYKGHYYTVAFDNDTQPYVYRWDLSNDPKEMKEFDYKYGEPLDFPKTWEKQAKIAGPATASCQSIHLLAKARVRKSAGSRPPALCLAAR